MACQSELTCATGFCADEAAAAGCSGGFLKSCASSGTRTREMVVFPRSHWVSGEI